MDENNGSGVSALDDISVGGGKIWGGKVFLLSLALTLLLMPFVEAVTGGAVAWILNYSTNLVSSRISDREFYRHFVLTSGYITLYLLFLLFYKISAERIAWFISFAKQQGESRITPIGAILIPAVFLLMPFIIFALVGGLISYLLSFTGNVFRFVETLFDFLYGIMSAHTVSTIIFGVVIVGLFIGWIVCKLTHGVVYIDVEDDE